MPSRVLQLRNEKSPKSSKKTPELPILPVPESKDEAFPTALTRTNTSTSTTSSTSTSSIAKGFRVFGHQESSAPELVTVILKKGQEDLPAVPYKLRFALSPQEWDERITAVNVKRERSGRPVYVLAESIWFFFALAIPGAISFPIYLAILRAATNTRQDPQMTAAGLTVGIGLLLFFMFLAPLFIRRWLIQRRMNKMTLGWQTIDRERVTDKTVNVLWKVSLPAVFQTTCRIVIPVPPRTKTWSLEALLQSDKLSSMFGPEYGAGAPLSRVDSISSRSMFED